MKRIYNPTTVTDTMDNLDRMRRLYRGVNDVAKRLEDEKNHYRSVADIFASSQELLRAKLRDYCEKLIYQDYQGHGRKIEELLWRKGFYEVFCAAKKLKKGNIWSDMEKAMVSSHLIAGIGFYNHLVLGLQLEYDLNVIDTPDIQHAIKQTGLMNNVKSKANNKSKGKDNEQCKKAILRFIHRSLTCIGDLERYRLDLDPLWIHWLMAVRYYNMANSIDHTIGMPHNQLGTVSGNQNYGLDAAYHYLRCMLCTETFEGAECNLKRIIEIHSFTGNEEQPLHRCIARILSLLQLWDSNVPNNDKINQDSQALLKDVQVCLSMEINPDTIESEPITFFKQIKTSKPEYLTDEMMLKILSICLMFITKLQSKKLVQVQGATAFTLALLSLLIHFVNLQIQKSYMSVSYLTEKNFQFEDEQEIVTEAAKEINVLNNGNNESMNYKSKRYSARHKACSMLTKLRRSRRFINSSDSDASDTENCGRDVISDGDMNSDISETEEDVLSFDGVSDDFTDDEIEESAAEINEKMSKLECTDKPENEKLDTAKGFAYIRSKLQPFDIINVLSTNGMLSSIKICFDWLKSDPEILKRCARSATALIKRTCKLINLINFDLVELLKALKEKNISYDSNCWELYSSTNDAIIFSQIMPLPEDVRLRGISIFDKAHENLDWKKGSKRKMSSLEETLLRILKLVNFGEYLCSIKDHTGVVFDEDNNIFQVLETEIKANEQIMDEPEEDVVDDIKTANEVVEHMNDIANNMVEQVAKTESVVINTNPMNQTLNQIALNEMKEAEPIINNGAIKIESDKGKLMRDMGTLWLQAEVRALESRLHSKLMPPFLVPDHETLVNFMPTLKRLFHSKKFVVVIPSIVVSTLDDMKRSSPQAREATRWLEIQLERGSRFLKAQTPNERLPLPWIKGPKPKDRESWMYFQIIECCYYLAQKTHIAFQGDNESPVVTLLMGSYNNLNNDVMRNSIVNSQILSNSNGVNVEHIQVFHTKWKATSKSHG